MQRLHNIWQNQPARKDTHHARGPYPSHDAPQIALFRSPLRIWVVAGGAPLRDGARTVSHDFADCGSAVAGSGYPAALLLMRRCSEPLVYRMNTEMRGLTQKCFHLDETLPFCLCGQAYSTRSQRESTQMKSLPVCSVLKEKAPGRCIAQSAFCGDVFAAVNFPLYGMVAGWRKMFAPISDTVNQVVWLRAVAHLITPFGLTMRENGGAS